MTVYKSIFNMGLTSWRKETELYSNAFYNKEENFMKYK